MASVGFGRSAAYAIQERPGAVERDWGRCPLLQVFDICRDLTDSYHRDPRGHLWGNEQMIAHIERYWCPTLTSDQPVGGVPFHFQETR